MYNNTFEFIVKQSEKKLLTLYKLSGRRICLFVCLSHTSDVATD